MAFVNRQESRKLHVYSERTFRHPDHQFHYSDDARWLMYRHFVPIILIISMRDWPGIFSCIFNYKSFCAQIKVTIIQSIASCRFFSIIQQKTRKVTEVTIGMQYNRVERRKESLKFYINKIKYTERKFRLLKFARNRVTLLAAISVHIRYHLQSCVSATWKKNGHTCTRVLHQNITSTTVL